MNRPGSGCAAVSQRMPTSASKLSEAASAGLSWAVVVYNITQVSFRQRLCPPALLGRMNATVRFVVFGTMPLGALLGGALGTGLGVLPTLWIAVAGEALAALWVLTGPLPRMRELPRPEMAAGAGQPAR